MNAPPVSGALWGPQWSLVVNGAVIVRHGRKIDAIEITGSELTDKAPGGHAALRMKFEVRADDEEFPNTAIIRVYNPSADTIKQIEEFQSVQLEAGFQANYGQIFSGTIKQVRIGRENNVSRYVDIYAADGDIGYNFGTINTTLKAGATWSDMLAQAAQAIGASSVASSANGYLATGGILPRGAVLWGMARDAIRDIAGNNGCRWSIQQNVITLIPNTGYLPGRAIVLNSQSGLIGMPEQTDNGIVARCLLNPLIRVGQAVQINNNLINQTTGRNGQPMTLQRASQPYYVANTSADGLYRVMVAEHAGDTRGNDWYTELTCLSIDPSSSVDSSVLANG